MKLKPNPQKSIARPLFRLGFFSSSLALLLCFSCLPGRVLAQTKNLPSIPALALFNEGKYEAAAARGLSDLLVQPWNHELRLVVADSLQNIGKIDEAKIQLETLKGTPLAKEASARLLALQKPQPAAAPLVKSAVPPAVAVVAPVVRVAEPAQAVTSGPLLTPPQIVAPSPPQIAVPSLSVAPLPSSSAPILTATQSVATPAGALIPLAPFQYIPAPGARLKDQAEQPKRSPEQQRIVDLSLAGDYQAAGTAGLALQAKENLDDELKLTFANSLAWSGRLPEATQTYQGLTTGAFAKEANIRMANIDRWLGYDHRAAKTYRSVLDTDPGNPDALQGLKLASRELSPRTTVSFGGSNDSSDLVTRALTANHRWRDSTGANVMEVETSGFRGQLPTIVSDQKDATFRYKALEHAYKPSFEISTIGNALYGGVGVSLGERPILVEAGVVNWGRLTANPNALSAQLSATHLGLQAAQGLPFGKLVGRVDHYGVSDGNSVLTTSVRLSPSWRPLGSKIKPLLGMETRDVKFNTVNYWSPAQGYGSVYAGLLGEWGSDDWNFYTSGQVGTRLYGEAGNSWSWTAGGKRWITDDLALSLNLWGLSNQRDSLPYRANTYSVQLEKLWK